MNIRNRGIFFFLVTIAYENESFCYENECFCWKKKKKSFLVYAFVSFWRLKKDSVIFYTFEISTQLIWKYQKMWWKFTPISQVHLRNESFGLPKLSNSFGGKSVSSKREDLYPQKRRSINHVISGYGRIIMHWCPLRMVGSFLYSIIDYKIRIIALFLCWIQSLSI